MHEKRTTVYINKAQQVARLLLDRIIDEEMRPGSSFGTEADLLDRYHVSRPTMRECLRILESQGVLSLRPGPKGGIIVAKPSVDVLAQTLSVYLQLHDVPMMEILRARMAIEPTLVRDAALNGTAEQFDQMERSVERLEASKDDDGTVLYRENREFHNIIARAAANPVLEVFWLTIRSLASGEGEHMRFSEKNRKFIAKAHRAILDACRRRDADAAQQLIAEHLGELDVLLKTRDKLLRSRLDAPARMGQASPIPKARKST
jgi:GntR family transcriptional regulator, transcriptional repressor for pyruvate dehydrogenase complex